MPPSKRWGVISHGGELWERKPDGAEEVCSFLVSPRSQVYGPFYSCTSKSLTKNWVGRGREGEV